MEKQESDMNGVTKFVYGDVSVDILGCPYDVLIELSRCNYDVKIKTNKNIISFRVQEWHGQLYNWVCNRGVSRNICEKLNEWIGFIPFYEYRDDDCDDNRDDNRDEKRWYVPEADCKTLEEMCSRKKPMQTQTFMKVPDFPVAILREMSTLCELADTVPEMNGFPEEIDIGKMDPDVAVHFTDAMKTLVPKNRSSKTIRLEYFVIYDFLGLRKLEPGKKYFIHGDRVMEATPANLAIAGQLWDYLPIALFPEFHELGNPHELTGCEHLSDNMIEEYKLWKLSEVFKMGNIPELSPIQVRLMQYLLRRNGH